MSCIVKDLSGQRFERLFVLEFFGFNKHNKCAVKANKESQGIP